MLVGLDWAEPMMSFCFACHMFMYFPCIRTLFSYLIYMNCLGLFWLFFFSSPLLPKTLLVLVLLHLLIFLLLLSSSVMMKPLRHSWRTSLDEAFIRNAKSFCRILPTLTFPLSFIVGDGSHCVTSWSHVLSCLSRSSTPTYTWLIVQYLSFSLAFEVGTFLSHRS